MSAVALPNVPWEECDIIHYLRVTVGPIFNLSYFLPASIYFSCVTRSPTRCSFITFPYFHISHPDFYSGWKKCLGKRDALCNFRLLCEILAKTRLWLSSICCYCGWWRSMLILYAKWLFWAQRRVHFSIKFFL